MNPVRVLSFDVVEQNIISTGNTNGIVRGTHNYIQLVFTYKEEWRKADKIVISMYNSEGEQLNEVVNNGVVKVPQEITKGSMFYFELTMKEKDVVIKTNKHYIEQT